MDYILTMTFLCANGDKTSISIDGVKTALATPDVVTLMETIIANNIFSTKNGILVEKYGAQLTQRQVTKLEVQ